MWSQKKRHRAHWSIQISVGWAVTHPSTDRATLLDFGDRRSHASTVQLPQCRLNILTYCFTVILFLFYCMYFCCHVYGLFSWKGPFSVTLSWQKKFELRIFFSSNQFILLQEWRGETHKIILQKYRFYNPFSRSSTYREVKNTAFWYKTNSFCALIKIQKEWFHKEHQKYFS